MVVFFDDILIYSQTLSDHINHLRLVLQTLQDNQFFVKRSKCSFGQHLVKYLGHIVSDLGVNMDHKNVQAMMEWLEPKNVKELTGFLGLTSYYRHFFKGYASITGPLTNLLKQNAYQWSLLAQQAFTALKTAMSSAPVLTLPNFGQDFVLEIDASNFSIGVVLMQHEQPISYFSKKLSMRLQQASAYVRELYAITEAVKNWR